MSNLQISIATVVYFSDIPMLRQTIESVQQSAHASFSRLGYTVDYKVIDNTGVEGYLEKLYSLCAEFENSEAFTIHIIQSDKNIGYGAGNNLVLRDIDSRYHLVINPDVILQLDAISEAIEYMESNTDVAMLAPMVMDGNKESHVIKVYPDCFTLMLRYLNFQILNRYFRARMDRYRCIDIKDNPQKGVELVGGCFLFFRSRIFKKLKGFDEYFFLYFEDYDISIRTRSFGEIAYVPAVKISHAGGGVGRKKVRHHVLFAMSAMKFFSRYGWRLW